MRPAAVPILLGLALALSLAGLAYEQVRTQRRKDAEIIQRLRRQLREHRPLLSVVVWPARRAVR